MRRIVEEIANRRAGARRGRSLMVAPLLALAIADRAPGGEGDGPELAPPAEMPPIVSRPATRSAVPPTTLNATGQRAVLAVPGGMAIPGRPSSPPATPAEPLDPGGELSLDAPIEMRPAPSPSRVPSSTAPGRSPRPLVLESTPMGDDPLPDEPSTKRPSTTRPQPIPAPVRRPRLFGPRPVPMRSAPPAAARPGSNNRSDDENLRDDPAAESALKRRVERQAREALGDRVRSVEVRVVGKDVVILARGVRFYQRRGVRKSLETLPSLSGLRSVIEVAD